MDFRGYIQSLKYIHRYACRGLNNNDICKAIPGIKILILIVRFLSIIENLSVRVYTYTNNIKRKRSRKQPPHWRQEAIKYMLAISVLRVGMSQLK